jgi:hypothetical protein
MFRKKDNTEGIRIEPLRLGCGRAGNIFNNVLTNMFHLNQSKTNNLFLQLPISIHIMSNNTNIVLLSITRPDV